MGLGQVSLHSDMQFELKERPVPKRGCSACGVSLHRNVPFELKGYLKEEVSMDNKLEKVAILTVKQTLAPAFPDDPIKPPTFAGKDVAGNNKAQYVTYQ